MHYRNCIFPLNYGKNKTKVVKNKSQEINLLLQNIEQTKKQLFLVHNCAIIVKVEFLSPELPDIFHNHKMCRDIF